MTKAKELRDLPLEELEISLLDQRSKLFALVNENKQERRVAKPHRVKKQKKEIARLLTVIGEKKANNNQRG